MHDIAEIIPVIIRPKVVEIFTFINLIYHIFNKSKQQVRPVNTVNNCKQELRRAK